MSKSIVILIYQYYHGFDKWDESVQKDLMLTLKTFQQVLYLKINKQQINRKFY